MTCYVTGCAAVLPDRIVSNTELAPILGVTADWIESNSRIQERRWAAPDEGASDLAVRAVRAALDAAGLTAQEVGYLIGCTLSPDYQVPGISPLVQRKLTGCGRVPAVDLRVGCVAILYSLQLAGGLVETGRAGTVVCFGSEVQSKGLDLSRSGAEMSMLFGDGAGALVVSRHRGHPNDPSAVALRITDVLIETDGSFAEDLGLRAPGTGNGAHWLGPGQIADSLRYPSMNGRTVILHAVRKMADAATEITLRNGMTVEQVDLVVPHQANGNLIDALGKRLGVSRERIVSNVERCGNTSGASAFIALSQAWNDGRLKPGDCVLIVAFGAGFTWGAALCSVVGPE